MTLILKTMVLNIKNKLLTIPTFTFISCFLVSITGYSQEKPSIEKIARNPYYKHEVKIDTSIVTYYMSEFDKEKELPLVVYIQGSGYHSLFSKHKESIIPTSGHIDLTYLSQGKAKILIIEKPGVQYLDSMTSKTRNNLFDKTFSLDSWSERIVRVIEHTIQTEKIDTSKVMLIGHSEGGLVASRVANRLNQKISHVCIMAGEGPTQLYSLYAFANSGDFFNEVSKNSKERIQYIIETWSEIQKDSTNTEKLFWGFTYLRWHSFLSTSVIEELEKFNGSVLILQGTDDKHVYPESSKILYTSLISKGVDVKLNLIENADHSFQIKNTSLNGWKITLEKSLNWFLADYN